MQSDNKKSPEHSARVPIYVLFETHLLAFVGKTYCNIYMFCHCR